MAPIETRFFWPYNALKNIESRKYLQFKSFIQMMANCLIIGGFRYGPASRTQMYHERAERLLKQYKKDHNLSHMIDLANYAFLETQAPAFQDAYYDDKQESVTRKEFGTGGYISK